MSDSLDNALSFLATAGWVVLLLVVGYFALFVVAMTIAGISHSIDERARKKPTYREKLGYSDIRRR